MESRNNIRATNASSQQPARQSVVKTRLTLIWPPTGISRNLEHQIGRLYPRMAAVDDRSLAGGSQIYPFHAEEEIRDASSSGELDFEFFPCRLSMTGEYYIQEISAFKTPTHQRGFCAMLHFLGRPFMADMINEPFSNYLGYELVILLDQEGHSHLQYSGSSVI